jgi:acyl carrier protein
MEKEPGFNDEEGEQDEFFEEFKEMAAGILGIDVSRIDRDSAFADLEADSLDVVELAMAAEERYGIEIPEEDLRGMKTSGEFSDYLKRRVAEKPDQPS